MKKVGIATMVGGENYGNSLQNYAVQTLIDEAGYEAYTLKNKTKHGYPFPASEDKPTWRKLMPSYVRAYVRVRIGNRTGAKNSRDFALPALLRAEKNKDLFVKAKRSRIDKFAAFRERCMRDDGIPIDNLRFDREHLNEFAAFVCGSDQVWNPYYRTSSMVDFLQFAPEHKRIALAPSFGISEIPESRRSDYTEWLNAIPHLSVREDAGAKIIKDLTGRDAKVLLDPTFAVTKEQWTAFAKEPEHHPSGRYVFCYFLGNETRRYVRYINDYAEKNGCDVVNIFDIHDLGYYDTDPQEFVWLLSHAEAVFTDSFHGTAFSINMQVPFVVFERVEGGSSMSSRITSVLRKTKLEGRKFPLKNGEKIDHIDFSESGRIIENERGVIKQYLADALADAGKGNIPHLANRYHCTGCGACFNACRTGALQMQTDAEGFKYPKIDTEKCVNCGACERACPADLSLACGCEPEIFYAYAKDSRICANSSSGGLFSVLASRVLDAGGVVYGAGYDAQFGVCHKKIEKQEDISLLRTSKYVQSDTGTAFEDVKQELKSGRTVYFAGTPCQIAGLKQYLGGEYDNLYTQDIICHGVPSPGVWEMYLKQNHADKQISAISFRDKTAGWNDFSMKVTYSDGSSYRKLATEDAFEKAFLANLFLRPSCYQCQYKGVDRISDITLADYWGAELVHPELKDQQGVSLILIHSEKGRKLFSSVEDKLCFGKTDSERAVRMNSAAKKSVRWHRNRNRFFAGLDDMPVGQLVNEMMKPTADQRIKRFIKRNGAKVKKVMRKMKVIK